MDLDDDLSQSIERYRNRITENHSMVQETLENFLSDICLLLSNSIPLVKAQFSSNPNKTDLLMETSNFWQEILRQTLQVISRLQNDFQPMYLSDYTQLINNQKLGYPQPFMQILFLQESTEALVHSKDSLIFVGSPTQISQIISEFSEEISNCTHSLVHQHKPNLYMRRYISIVFS